MPPSAPWDSHPGGRGTKVRLMKLGKGLAGRPAAELVLQGEGGSDSG